MYSLIIRIQQQFHDMILGAEHHFIYLNAWRKQDEHEKKMKTAKKLLPKHDNDAMILSPNNNPYRRTYSTPRPRMFPQKQFKEEENMGIELMPLLYNTY